MPICKCREGEKKMHEKRAWNCFNQQNYFLKKKTPNKPDVDPIFVFLLLTYSFISGVGAEAHYVFTLTYLLFTRFIHEFEALFGLNIHQVCETNAYLWN